MTGSNRVRLDDQLEALTAGIVEIGGLLPEVKAKLRPPLLKVVKGVPNGLNNYCVPKQDGTKIILVGGLLYSFFLHYTHAAATYFLPEEPGGPCPSPLWPQARSALATTLDWIASPASEPILPSFDLTPHQEQVASAFAAFAFRFALCHEIAHVVLDHVDGGPSALGRVKDADVAVLRVSQQQELDADECGLDLQIRSLQDRTQLVTALASSVYFVYITGLLDGRLMLLAHLVNPVSWKIALTHPPALARMFHLMRTGQAYGDAGGKGLQSVSESLGRLNAEIWNRAIQQQDAVAEETTRLLERSLREVSSKADATKVASNTKAVRKLGRLVERSPLGVMRALDVDADDAGGNGEDARMLRSWKDQLSSTLPPELRPFRGLDKAERAEELA